MFDTRVAEAPRMSRRNLLRAAAVTGAGVLFVPALGADAFADSTPPAPTIDPLSRFVWVEGSFNTRDFGGYTAGRHHTVALGVLWRSASLHHTTAAGLTALAGLNLKVVADFRSQVELARGLDILPPGVSPLQVPVGDPETPGAGATVNTGPPPPGGYSAPDPATLEEFRGYITATEACQSFGTAIRALASPANRPFLWHCNSGTYRTGWASAVLLTALGVPREQVYDDFLLSNLPLGATYAFPEYLDAAFAQADAVYGSFHQYLRRGLGVSPSTVEYLRHNLLVCG